MRTTLADHLEGPTTQATPTASIELYLRDRVHAVILAYKLEVL
ncbi:MULTISPECIES: hypothetical protein [unclassified Microbacterium]|nr:MULTISPECIES: hypothetical protein [unclassified Microbacterium]